MKRENTMNKNNIQPLQAVSEREASKLTGKAVQSLRNDRHLRRGLPYCKLGRSVRYLLNDIHEYLLKNRIDPEAKV
jgi:hypothetical protein